jgi:hypothetical protein
MLLASILKFKPLKSKKYWSPVPKLIIENGRY